MLAIAIIILPPVLGLAAAWFLVRPIVRLLDRLPLHSWARVTIKFASVGLVFVCLTVGITAAGWGYLLYQSTKNTILALGPAEAAVVLLRTAPIPGEIVEGDVSIFMAGTCHIVARADRAAIDAWIEASPTLHNVKPSQIYSTSFPLVSALSMPARKDQNSRDPKAENDVWLIHRDFDWFRPASVNGVRYDVPNNELYDRGTVLIDWDTNTIWIYAAHS